MPRLVDYLFSALSNSIGHIDKANRKNRSVVAVTGALVTVFIWTVHLRNPLLTSQWPEPLRNLTMFLIFGISFVAIVSGAYFLFPDPPDEKRNGPMSGYLREETARKGWKIMITAGMLSAAKLFLLAITSSW
jgi:hypothetical protein